jgi:two-component system CheB/CheR fusion protein
VSPDEESLVRQLESELQTTQEDLQSTIEEMEAANEELKVSNEEVMSMNEELQSTNEELETSKEEMQSLNEELSTVNVQLQEKIEELEAANSDVANLLRCSDVAIMFLDTHFRIKRFTPLVTRLFKLIASDLGREFSDIAPKFTDANLQEDMEGVLRTLSPRDKQVQAADGSWWSRRITPYQTPDNRVEGVTITFHDVTRLKVADAQAQRLAAITMDSNDAIIVHDMNGTINAWNRGAHEMFGYSESEAIGKNVSMLNPDAGSLTRSKGPHAIPSRSWETQRRTKDGRILDVWVTATILKGAHGEIVAIAKTERDITTRKELEREVVEIASLEQRRIGQDMHDTVGQELTALNLLVGDLADVIRSNRTGAVKLVKQIIQGMQRVRNDLRTVLRGLLPVAIESDGLTAALSDLADRVRQEHSLDCAFESQDSVALPESSMATHLYLIAQEAVRNAIQHAQPKRIRISLKVGDYLVLQIEDDGMGMPTYTSENHGGLGLRIMRNRAAVIGATLTVHSNLPRGTLVTCALSRATS